MLKIENFILECGEAFTKEYCNEVIEYFDAMEKGGLVSSRSSFRKDQVSYSAISLHDKNIIALNNSQKHLNHFLDVFWNQLYKQYVDEYSIIDAHKEHRVENVKIQKYSVGDGYHLWHNECMSGELSKRFLTFLVYLNDVNEGGETEFLYYPKRIKAEQGKALLFPGHFTHTHRGNPVISNQKYIITGWVEY